MTLLQNYQSYKSRQSSVSEYSMYPTLAKQMCMESLTPVFGQLPLWNHLELFIILWLLIKGANFIVKEVDHLTHRYVVLKKM